MNIEIGRHRIRPYADTCWQIDRKARKKETGEEYWRPLERYPSTFKGAVSQCVEFELKDGGDVEGWREVIKRLDEIADMIAGLEVER